jgi:hypothetical protein
VRFAHTLVSPHGFREPGHNEHRLGRLRELLTRLAAERLAFVAIPAGYLTVRTEDDVTPAVAEIADTVETSGVAVIGGVDVIHPKRGKADVATDDLVADGRLPYFGFAAFPSSVTADVPVWRQASTTNWNGNAGLAPEETLPGRSRLVECGGRTVLPLLCGELFNWRVRERASELVPHLVIDVGHISMGTGVIPAMRNVANAAGCPVAHTQHVKNGAFHFISADGEQRSIPSDEQEYVGDDEFWIGWCVREV